MKIEDNHYTYRIETKDPNGGSLDFIDIDTVEPLRCAYDVQDELNLETNEHIKRVEEIVLDANSTEFWYVDEARTSDTHLVCYFEEVQLMAHKDHPMVDTDRSIFEYGKINSNEHQDTNFICTHVMDNGVSRIYMSIDKETFEFATFNNETIKHFISNNPVTIWYALRYEVIIPRSLSKGHLLTLDGQTDISLTTNNEQAKLPIMKFNIGDTQYTLDTNPIHINNTQEGTQIRNIVLEGNTPINYARGNGVNTTEATSDTRYDFEPFYDGQATIQGTVEGGYVSAKLYGDTMVNIAKPYGETPLLTATNASTLCDDLLGANEEGIVLADGEITEGRIYGDSSIYDANIEFVNGFTPNKYLANTNGTINSGDDCVNETYYEAKPFIFKGNITYKKVVFYDISKNRVSTNESGSAADLVMSTIPLDAKYMRFSYHSSSVIDVELCNLDGSHMIIQIQSVVNPTVYNVNENLFDLDYVFNQSNYKDCGAFYPSVKIQLKPNTSYYFERNTSGTTNEFKNTYIVISTLENPKSGGTWITHATAMDSPKTVTFTTGDSGIIHFCVAGVLAEDGQQHLDSLRELHFSNAFLVEDSSTNKVYTPHYHTQATFPYTLNKLPNGVADYIDVVNKVHVKRVGIIEDASTLNWMTWLNNPLEDGTVRFVGSIHISSLPDGATINGATFMSDKLIYKTSMNDDLALYSVSDFVFVTFLRLTDNTLDGFKAKMSELRPKILYQLATPIYTPLTEEEIAQLPLSAYADGYVNLSSDQLMPSFEFRMKASNRYQVDMLETGYYYLNAPVGSVKLGTANVDVQQMPCIVKVDNVGTGDSGYRLGFSGDIMYTDVASTFGGFISSINGTIDTGGSGDSYTDFIKANPNSTVSATTYIETPITNGYGVVIGEYDSNKNFIKITATEEKTITTTTTDNTHYIRVSYRCGSSDNIKKIKVVLLSFITLAKLPSHRIPTTFTQGMKCATDFGYWQGIKVAKPLSFRTVNNSTIVEEIPLTITELNRIEYNNTIVEDEFDITTGKLTKRIGKTFIGYDEINSISSMSTDGNTYYCFDGGFSNYFPNWKSRGAFSVSNIKGYGGHRQITPAPVEVEFFMSYIIGFNFKMAYGWGNKKKILLNEMKRTGGFTVLYELQVPEISYISLSANQIKTTTDATLVQSSKYNESYLNPQVKPSHLTYPVPSLVGNRTYTVVHNRKNITGSTKPIELNLGGTVTQLNDASSKTLVKTPSTLAHSNLIFIGGESTVDHVMVLDGDWTNKPIEYFENMMGHDTDAIITIIGNGQINDVEEQYLW